MKKSILIVGVLWMIGWTIFLTRVPGFNGDTIFYMGVVTEYEEPSPERIHQKVYATLKKEALAYKFENLTESNDYLKNCFSDPAFFYDQLSFYRVKPLYTFLIYGLHKIGFKLTNAMIFLSVVGFWGIIFFTFYWLKEFLEINHAGIISLSLTLFYPLVMLARLFSPDALSNLLVLISFYFFINHFKKYKWIIFGFIAILVRVDNVIVILMMLIFSAFKEESLFSLNKKLLRNIGIASILSFTTVALLTFFVGNNYDWLLKFTHLFSFNHYLSNWAGVPDSIIRSSSFPLLIVFLAVCLPIIKKETRIILALVFGIIGLRLLLFPSFQERFFIAFEIVILIIIVQSLTQSALLNSVKWNDWFEKK